MVLEMFYVLGPTRFSTLLAIMADFRNQLNPSHTENILFLQT